MKIETRLTLTLIVLASSFFYFIFFFFSNQGLSVRDLNLSLWVAESEKTETGADKAATTLHGVEQKVTDGICRRLLIRTHLVYGKENKVIK